MGHPVHVENEVAYDLLQDHLDLILRLMEHPASREEVERLAGSAKTVARLERYGLIRATASGMEAMNSTYQKYRQEGMVSFLERYVLPSLSVSANASRTTSLLNRTFSLPEQVRRSMLEGPVQSFFEELSVIADAPIQGPEARLQVLVIGADEVQDHEPERSEEPHAMGEVALRHLQNASRLRAAADTRDRAVVSLFVCMADIERFNAVTRRMHAFLDRFEPHTAGPAESNYQLMVASHLRSAAIEEEGVLQ